MAKHYTKVELREIYNMINKKCWLQAPFHEWLTDEEIKFLRDINVKKGEEGSPMHEYFHELQQVNQQDFIRFFYEKK